MVDATQVALPLAVLVLVAGGSLVAWTVLFLRAARVDAALSREAGAPHDG